MEGINNSVEVSRGMHKELLKLREADKHNANHNNTNDNDSNVNEVSNDANEEHNSESQQKHAITPHAIWTNWSGCICGQYDTNDNELTDKMSIIEVMIVYQLRKIVTFIVMIRAQVLSAIKKKANQKYFQIHFIGILMMKIYLMTIEMT